MMMCTNILFYNKTPILVNWFWFRGDFKAGFYFGTKSCHAAKQTLYISKSRTNGGKAEFIIMMSYAIQ